eukprot:COSAG02_NODE_179_length_31090_cov_49.813785_37_plen_34_part_00
MRFKRGSAMLSSQSIRLGVNREMKFRTDEIPDR